MGLLGESLKNLFSKPATKLYPVEKYTPVEGYRGEYDMDQSTCIYCGLCARACPAGCITVDKKTSSYRINVTRCISCLACQRACPKQSIHFSEKYTAPTLTRKWKFFQTLPEGQKPPTGAEIVKKTKSDKGVLWVYYTQQDIWVGDEYQAERRKKEWEEERKGK